jgi:hypothetical protein
VKDDPVEVDDPKPIEALTCEELCLECDRPWIDRFERWRAYVSDEGQLLVYCPACATREFDS